jgi:hypothetical protein
MTQGTRRSRSVPLVVAIGILALPAAAQDPPRDPLLDEWRDDWIDPTAPDGGAPGERLPTFIDFDLVRGLRFQGPDGVPRLRVGGKIDLTGYLYDDRNQRDSEVRFENGELRLDGEALGRTWLRLVGDLDGRGTRDGLVEATISGGRPRSMRLAAGLQEISLGIESSLPEDELPFIGPAFSPWVVERTDLSVRLDGELLGGFLGYDAGWSFGEGFDIDAERVDDPRLSLRLVLYPLTADALVPASDGAWRVLEGLFLSSSYAYESSLDRSLAVETPYKNRLCETTELDGEAAEWWLFGWGLDAGRVRLIHEWSVGRFDDVETATGEVDLGDPLSTMAATLSVRLLGDPVPYDSHPYRKRPDLSGADWTPPNGERPSPARLRFPGQVELALRYAEGDVDQRLFDLGLADPAISSPEFRTFTAAVSSRPAPRLRIILEGTRVIADGDPAAFDSHGRDTSFALRVEYLF